MKSVIYIDRTNLYYYGGNVHTPVAFPFPKTAVNDMEIISETELTTQIEEWIKAHKIEPTQTILLLSNSVYFQKEIPPDTPMDKQTEMKKQFIDNVPFNDTHLQEIQVAKSTLLVAINTEFVYAIRDIFHSFGFNIEAIAPVAEIYGLQPISSFSVTVAQDALKKITKSNGFPLHPVEENPSSQSEDPLPQPQSNHRLFIMLGVFIILIGILAIVYLTRAKPKKRTVVTVPTTVPVQKMPTQIPSLAPSMASTAASINTLKETITIEVLNGSGIPGQADTIRQELLDKGFKNITTGNATEVQSNRTLIVVKKEVTEQLRNDIIEVIKLYGNDYTIQEKTDIGADVLITTSRQTATPTP